MRQNGQAGFHSFNMLFLDSNPVSGKILKDTIGFDESY